MEGPRRVRSYAFVVSNILNIMNSLNLINLLINRARTRAALGTPFSKRTPPPSRRRAGAEPLTNRRGKNDPPNLPKANIHRFFGDPRVLRKTVDFRTPQNRPRWVTKSPIGRPMAANGSIWNPPHPPDAWRRVIIGQRLRIGERPKTRHLGRRAQRDSSAATVCGHL